MSGASARPHAGHPDLRAPSNSRRGFLTSGIAAAALAADVPPSWSSEPGRDEWVGMLPGRIAAAARAEIAAARLPGAVVLVGTRDRILCRQAYGARVLGPAPVAMTVDTMFDLASLTKVVATTPAVLQLVDSGVLGLERPVAQYWPEFSANGKDRITLRDLLTHYSGLRADLCVSAQSSGYEAALRAIAAQAPVAPPRTAYLYSDLNFEILGEVVRRVTDLPLDRYCQSHLYGPLGMHDTMFLPSAALRSRIAPTQDTTQHTRWGEVHDAVAHWMGGVSGNAGLFSTADDLSIYARLILSGGSLNGTHILRKQTVEQMTTRQSPPGHHVAGLGWALGGPDGYAGFPAGTFGHLGYTGAMLWIDPRRQIYAIVLTNRTYPTGDAGNADPLRMMVIAAVIGRDGRGEPSGSLAAPPNGWPATAPNASEGARLGCWT